MIVNRPVIVLTAEETAARTLRRAGIQVIEAVDGVEVLQQIQADVPDVAVLDVLLPGLGALEVCRQLHTTASQTPVILVGARGDPAARIDGLRAGADDYLVKPYDPGELVARVEALVRRRRRSASQPVQAASAGEDCRDPLTGLADHDTVTARLEELIERASREHETLSVLTVDLDGFEAVNARFGRGAGDRLLAACGRAIVRACRDQDLVGRAGGDEFVVLLPHLHFAGSIPVAERVVRAVRDTAIVEGGARVAAVASVGVASFPSRDIEGATDLLRYAHAALARAKAEGRGHVCLYQHHGYLLSPT